MGRNTESKNGLISTPMLWREEDLPHTTNRIPEKNFQSLRYPLWSYNKARLIQAYLQLFLFITKHGTYIDGFSAPQSPDHPETWSAKLVLEMTPKWLRDFWLCDVSAPGIAALNALAEEHRSQKRRVTVLDGDFNLRVHDILKSGQITEKTATFALLDQRTFECEWSTVQALSQHKAENKIELFYFFATGWLDRSIAAVSRPETQAKVERWWGRGDWADLRGLDPTLRAKQLAKRFEDELGFKKANVFAIHDDKRGGRVMYHMIHATDHPEAPALMIRAYRKVSGRSELAGDVQLDLDDLLERIEKGED